MAYSKAGFMEYLAGEAEKYRGIYVPVRSGPFRRLLVTRLPCRLLHPNPDDEFCRPEIGPNFDIISRYVEQARRMKLDVFNEPLIVERIWPDGYMILNGHHRWAAALITGVRKVPVSIVNLTHKMDVQRILWNSSHEKRIALDLDEVVFCADAEAPAENGPRFPFNRKYTQRLRLGIPGLFRAAALQGYDIWVYSREYYSLEYVRALFRLYHIHVTGIVTGINRRRPSEFKAQQRVEKLITSRYHTTIAIDQNVLLYVDHTGKAFEEYDISGSAAGWSSRIMDRIGRIEKKCAT